MKITHSDPINLVSVISMKIIEKDYKEQVEKNLKNYQKTTLVPGFRKGKTPMQIIIKKYKKAVLIDEINKLIQSELYKYISSDKLQILGSPISIEDNVNWDQDKDFLFKYEVGLAPKFDVDISNKDKLDYYNINVDKKLIDKYCDDIAKRNGKMINPDISKEGDLIFCNIQQLNDNKEIIKQGIKNDATVSMDYISDQKIKKKFIGVSEGDVIDLDIKKSFTNLSDLAAMLNIKQEEINQMKFNQFRFIVNKINRMSSADLNLDLFEKVYGKGSVKNLKEFKLKIKEEAESQFNIESDRMLKNDVVIYLLSKLKLEMPDDFLKKWLLKNSEKPLDPSVLERDYENYVKSLQWQLIENKIIEKYQLKVDEDEVKNHVKGLVKVQMKQYGQIYDDETKLDEIVHNILQNDDERKKIYDQIYDKKTLLIYKDKFKLKEKSISYDDFVKLASKK